MMKRQDVWDYSLQIWGSSAMPHGHLIRHHFLVVPLYSISAEHYWCHAYATASYRFPDGRFTLLRYFICKTWRCETRALRIRNLGICAIGPCLLARRDEVSPRVSPHEVLTLFAVFTLFSTASCPVYSQQIPSTGGGVWKPWFYNTMCQLFVFDVRLVRFWLAICYLRTWRTTQFVWSWFCWTHRKLHHYQNNNCAIVFQCYCPLWQCAQSLSCPIKKFRNEKLPTNKKIWVELESNMFG